MTETELINSVGENGNDCSKVNNDKKPYKIQIVWRNVFVMIVLHIGSIYSLIYFINNPDHIQYKTIFYINFLGIISSMGIQCGAHRLWCHRAFKAKLPFQLILAFFQTMSLQNDIYEWSRDHRVHHKYSETDADPHNAKRGFFFSHVGWLLCKKHPDVIEKGKTVDMSDLEKDPLVKFQRKYYIPLVLVIWGIIPTLIPYYFWNESLMTSFLGSVIMRYTLTLNLTWCVNSAAHMWGMKPYDKSINPVECTIRHWLMGEGFHNYHHTFPWDYSASELGYCDVFNPATGFIDLFARIGWAYDLKKVSPELVKKRMCKTGDDQFKYRNSPWWELISGWFTAFLVGILMSYYKYSVSSVL